ncbi:type II toxin-antitoxin system RelE family toxin [Pseudomonas multiresinivorans]|uniref:Type II toxin-antitoxin system RelE/ParE family toxin n=1 Tax=Pseudomonas multiresinivorans TaxID=95301 RepID=A0A7Z3GSM8_9PSED|nr:type II toxin-antitoxin system RelE/ParE family toxin [Pseudomonas multiresinivorans]QJP11268.1 type II toxin-antitoxin system RelE/ParE family toxin [Pseudomonas multiresinivorans]
MSFASSDPQYRLAFNTSALKEWKKLKGPLKAQFIRKLDERLRNPHVPSARLHGAANRYKIKLASMGYRLVYEVFDDQVVVLVIAVGKRERGDVYKAAQKR